MKYTKWILVTSTAVCLSGCASTPELALLEPVGPAPASSARPLNEGTLQVFSARQTADVDVNEAVFRENNDFGKNDFLYDPAHTDYTVYTQDGKVFKHIRNARDQNDSEPALVTIPAGSYRVEAQAEVNGTTITVVLPVKIEPGRNTLAHLEGDWRPRAEFQDNEVVRLPDGQIVGWRAPVIERLTAQAKNSR